MLLRLLLLPLMLVLAACTTPLPVQGGKLSPPAGQGVLLVAVTLDSFDRDSATATLVVDGPSGPLYLRASIATDYIYSPGNAATEHGKLYAVTVPAGDYRLSKMFGWWRLEVAHEVTHRYAEAPLNASVHVGAGETVYVGDAHLSLNFRPSAGLSDQHPRDFHDLAKRRNIATDDIAVRIGQTQQQAAF
ncbi:hypothetical protein SAMN02745857_02248 [Andreprevotia lacus DSM 23236]|uniref:Lipoprotein n=1 Tax=Andreprevotia lacus DSM 23236 TaxID=1121001 RepID=A0A1W1XPD8_9NEIS|nr:hypothetical protein [Andreprevotia lacus]SMC25715.1 hypothetical protein SAMN02745857_02248 [Andreprevotia lacus DSM 23236]